MTSTLNEMQAQLYKAFDKAIKRSDNDYSSTESRAQNLQAVALLAQAIAATDARIEARDESKTGLRLPGKPSV